MSGELLRELIKKIEGEIGFVGIEVWGDWLEIEGKKMRTGYVNVRGVCRFVVQDWSGEFRDLAGVDIELSVLEVMKGEVPGLIDQIMEHFDKVSLLNGVES